MVDEWKNYDIIFHSATKKYPNSRMVHNIGLEGG